MFKFEIQSSGTEFGFQFFFQFYESVFWLDFRGRMTFVAGLVLFSALFVLTSASKYFFLSSFLTFSVFGVSRAGGRGTKVKCLTMVGPEGPRGGGGGGQENFKNLDFRMAETCFKFRQKGIDKQKN